VFTGLGTVSEKLTRGIPVTNPNDNIILQHIHGTQQVYLATDSLKEVDNAGLISPDNVLDYVARQTPPGLPGHTLTVKTGGVYWLLWNFSLDRSLVKNVCVVVILMLGHK
jgi:hypothetical protein